MNLSELAIQWSYYILVHLTETWRKAVNSGLVVAVAFVTSEMHLNRNYKVRKVTEVTKSEKSLHVERLD